MCKKKGTHIFIKLLLNGRSKRSIKKQTNSHFRMLCFSLSFAYFFFSSNRKKKCKYDFRFVLFTAQSCYKTDTKCFFCCCDFFFFAFFHLSLIPWSGFRPITKVSYCFGSQTNIWNDDKQLKSTAHVIHINWKWMNHFGCVRHFLLHITTQYCSSLSIVCILLLWLRLGEPNQNTQKWYDSFLFGSQRKSKGFALNL